MSLPFLIFFTNQRAVVGGVPTPEGAVFDGEAALYDGEAAFVDTPTNPAETLLAGLLAFWKMEEASGNRVDASGNARDLTPSGTVTQQTGKLSFAASMSTSSRLSRDVTGLFDSYPFTLAGWLYPSSGTAGQKDVYSFAAASGNPPIGLVRSGSALLITGVDNTEADALSDGLLSAPNNTWVFLRLVVLSDTKARLYVNEAAPETLTLGAGLTFKTGIIALSLGRKLVGGAGVTQRHDAVGVWNRILSNAEAAYLYNSGNGRELPFS